MAASVHSRRQVLGLLGAAALPKQAIAATLVDLALVLAIDCSYSVDYYEYQLQMRGTGQAFLDSKIIEAISRGPNRKIAVSAFLWSDADEHLVIVPWRIFATKSDATEIADIFLRMPRNVNAGTTATGSALLFAKDMLDDAPPSLRRVVDVSTDGLCNTGAQVPAARDQLVAAGITINGLAIENEVVDLSSYLSKSVIGGDGHFVVSANDYEGFAAAIKMKLFREITDLNMS